MAKYNHCVNSVLIPFTAEEEIVQDALIAGLNSKSGERKLELIKEIREQKLQETDWWVMRGDITDAQKLYRKNLRDIPQNNTTEAEYDLILARDGDKKLTHAIWSKP